jgi:hypothetical protein
LACEYRKPIRRVEWDRARGGDPVGLDVWDQVGDDMGPGGIRVVPGGTFPVTPWINFGKEDMLKLSSLMEVLVAAHMTEIVDSPFTQRGGIMLVAPPGNLKSTMVASAYEHFPDAKVLSDINIQTLIGLRDDIAAKRLNTLAFTEIEKLYQRHAATAGNIEGHLKAMVEEGFSRASFEDQRMFCLVAKCLVVGSMVPIIYRQKYTQWQANGFLRRFLWVTYTLKDQDALMRAIHNWKKLTVRNGIFYPIMMGGSLPYKVSEADSRTIRKMVHFQPGQETPYVLLKKIYSVLLWKHKGRKAMTILDDFAESLGRTGATLSFD